MEGEEAQSKRRSTLRSRSGAIRKPFSDRTNTIPQSQSSPATLKPYSQRKTKPSNPISIASGGSAADPSTPKPSTPPGGDENQNIVEVPTVGAQKRTAEKGKGKEKALAVPLGSYSADRVVNVGSKRKEFEDLGILERSTVPLKKINFDLMERRALAVKGGDAAQSQRRSTLTSGDSSRSRTNRTPLSDCTNTIFESQSQYSPETVVATRPKPPHPPPWLPPHPNPTTAATESTTNYADPSTPPPSKPSSSPGEFRTVYTRRQTADKSKGKRKALPVHFSSYSADRIVNAGTRRNEYEDMGLPEPHTVPLKKKQRRGKLKQDGASKQALQDYIEQQKAYFDEVDAFELEEEVGSGNELD